MNKVNENDTNLDNEFMDTIQDKDLNDQKNISKEQSANKIKDKNKNKKIAILSKSLRENLLRRKAVKDR